MISGGARDLTSQMSMGAARADTESGTKPVGILAFGSLIWDPGCLAPHIVDYRDVLTPWPVEYARGSKTRLGAPTLVKVTTCGSIVNAEILVLDVTNLDEATRILACREGCRNHSIKRTNELEGEHRDLSAVLYTALGSNLKTSQMAPACLALRAMCSCRKLKRQRKEDKNGIRYLAENIKSGVVTPLTCAYRQAILDACRVSTLEEAERHCLAMP